MLRLIPYSLTIAMLLLGASVVCGDDLNVPMEARTCADPGGMMHRCLMRQVAQAASRWRADYEKRKTPEEIAAHQKRMREEFLKAIGGLPERTPLNPQVVGCISRRGYRVEKIIFESQPKHYVTAPTFLPDPQRFKPPYPGVLVPCGHVTVLSKAHPEYQSMVRVWRWPAWPRWSLTRSTKVNACNSSMRRARRSFLKRAVIR